MKKLSFAILTAACMLFAGTGCLKDKGFDDNEYGINSPEDSPVGVGFPQGGVRKNTRAVNSQTSSQSIADPLVNLLSDEPAEQDITVTLALNPGIVSNWNSMDANGDGIPDNKTLATLPSNQYSIPTFTVVIPKGQRFANINIVIPNAAAIDASKTYGIGLSIVKVEPSNIVIAQNLKDILFEIAIKNRYDGKYNLSGVHNRPTLDAPYHDEPVHMVTTGPASVKMYWPAAGLDAHPINGAATYYGTFTTEFYFEDVPSIPAGSSGPLPSYKLIKVDNPYTPGSPPFTVGPATTSRYDPNTKTIYAQFYYNNNLARMFTDTLVYTGVR